MRRPAPLSPRAFRDRLEELGIRPDDRVLVALSGGLDSVALLHLLRFGLPGAGPDVAAAHLDHAMRPGSDADAAWVRGVARAWSVPLVEARLVEPPGDEAGARRLRYAFLESARRSTGSRWIATGHHADDQAETVLFRVLRGTGLRGLAGIPDVREEARLVRPLLPWWREEVAEYAAGSSLSWRTDPTNLRGGYARNVLRHELIPLAADRVAPGARRALVRLSRLARREDAGYRSLLREVTDEVVRERGPARVVVDRPRLLTYHREVRARVLRGLFRSLDVRLDEAGTRAVVQFTSSGASGRRLTLSGSGTLARDFDRLVLSNAGAEGSTPPPAPAETDVAPGGAGAPTATPIRAAETGQGQVVVGRQAWLVRWSVEEEPAGRWVERFRPEDLDFPLRVRGWLPGDRMRRPYGTKKVAKLFAEARVPVEERGRRPVVEDRHGRVVWIPGVARAGRSRGNGEEHGAFTIAMIDDD